MEFKTKSRLAPAGNRNISVAGDLRDRNLKRWVANSLLVDAAGNPLRLFHGTNQDFEVFDRTKSRDSGLVYLSPNPRIASAFAAYRSTWQGANVMPVFVRASKILEVEGNYEEIRDVEARYKPDGIQENESIAQYMLRNSIEVIVYRNVRDDVGPTLVPFADVYAVSPLAQIKSALGNIGTFNALDPRITR